MFDGSTLLLYGSTRPVTTVLQPATGTTLSGTNVVLDAMATSSTSGITKVQFVISGGSYPKTIIGTAGFAKFGYYLSWDTTSVPNGSYKLQSLATDWKGRTNSSPAITIKVDN